MEHNMQDLGSRRASEGLLIGWVPAEDQPPSLIHLRLLWVLTEAVARLDWPGGWKRKKEKKQKNSVTVRRISCFAVAHGYPG